MSNLQEKVNQEYPLYDIPNSVSRTDEYNGNEIQVIKRSAFQNGYEQCQKEYEEKLRWIPISEQFPPSCTFVDTMYKYTYAYLFHLENGEFDNCAYNPTHWRLKII